MRQLPLGIRLRSAAVFGNFLAGPNREAVERIRSSATGPIWLWGPAGSGKTHLLQAACADSVGPCAYLPLVTDEARERDALGPAALEGMEALVLVCIDNLERVAGDLVWERALFNLFNAAAETQTRLLFAARMAPAQIRWQLPDWGSRSTASTVYQLRALDDRECVEALRLRASARGLDLPLETAEYLLRRLPRDQQALFDLMDTLDEAALAAQRRLTVPFVRAALKLR